ncbi:MAG: hypothetical protein LUF87_01765 [Alistipes sp.]|nr:hypothetical protein [Alistipes sp.]
MAKFRNLLGSILNEFTQAQHQANDYASRLGKQYAENDLLRYFKIPNAYVDGLRFDLRFAVNPGAEAEKITEVNYRQLMQFFTQLAVSITETAITSVLYASEESVVSGFENYRKLREKEQVLKTDFRDYLSGILRKALVEKAINEVDPDGNPDPDKIFEIAMEVLHRKFFQHPELNLSGNMPGQGLSQEVIENCSSFVSTLIRHSCKSVNFLETRESEVIDVSIDADSLSKVAPENIQRIAFDVNLRNYQVSKMDTEQGSADCIIPAEH